MTLNEKKLKHKDEVKKLKEKITALESEPSFERDIRYQEQDNDREKNELIEKIEHMKWLNSSLKDENDKLREKLEDVSTSTKKEDTSPSASAKNNDKWRNVALQEQVAVLSQRVIELEEAAASSGRRSPGSPRKASILESPVMRSSLVNNGGPATPRSALRVSSYDDVNQANELLSSSAREDNTPANLGTPPSLPNRRDLPIRSSMPNLPKGKSKLGFNVMKRGSSYKMSPKASPRPDDASNSTTNYNF
jgi:hypothetical protein